MRKEIQRGNADRCAVTRPRTPHRAAPRRTAWRAWAVRQKAPGRIRLLCLRLPSGVARFSGRWYYCWRYLSAGTATPRRRRRSSGSGAKRAKGSDAVRRRPSAMCDAPPVLSQSLGTIRSSLHTEARRPRRRSAGGRHTAVAVTAHGSAAEVALPVHPNLLRPDLFALGTARTEPLRFDRDYLQCRFCARLAPLGTPAALYEDTLSCRAAAAASWILGHVACLVT